jgi:hypothetical protein
MQISPPHGKCVNDLNICYEVHTFICTVIFHHTVSLSQQCCLSYNKVSRTHIKYACGRLINIYFT